jgi:hypothetical protein
MKEPMRIAQPSKRLIISTGLPVLVLDRPAQR